MTIYPHRECSSECVAEEQRTGERENNNARTEEEEEIGGAAAAAESSFFSLNLPSLPTNGHNLLIFLI
jgi:hypothetical protein